jgi:hypothetical protein
VSEHHDAGAATEAAVGCAGAEGAATVLVHDLYSRVHPIPSAEMRESRGGR